MAIRRGIYGLIVPLQGKKTVETGTGHVNMRGAILSQNTNVHPAFGMDYKVKRNVAIISGPSSVWSHTWGIHGQEPFGNIQQKLSDPLHRDPKLLHQLARNESSIAGRSRAMIRPAAPQQVTWKNNYWILQRTRGRRGTTIGPYGTVSSRQPAQSIGSRINSFLTGG